MTMDRDAVTPGAQWREDGEADPHGTQYDCERAALTLGKLTDDELANGVFMNADQPMNLGRMLARDPDYHAPIVWLTAAKDRIRWLSRALERALAAPAAAQLSTETVDKPVDRVGGEGLEVRVLEGWRFVPVKINNAMIHAANNVPSGIAGSPPHWQWVWDAMLYAAPAASAGDQS